MTAAGITYLNRDQYLKYRVQQQSKRKYSRNAKGTVRYDTHYVRFSAVHVILVSVTVIASRTTSEMSTKEKDTLDTQTLTTGNEHHMMMTIVTKQRDRMHSSLKPSFDCITPLNGV